MKRVWWTIWAVAGLLVGTLLGCQSGEQPEPEYTYIYSEAPKPPVVANAMGLEGSPSMGAADAKVTIIESSDFQCPFCGRVVPTMKQLLEQYPNDVRVIFKHNPLGFHKRAMPAAKAAMAAHAQGKFWEYHDKLFQQKRFEDADFDRYAQELGLDMAAFKATYSDPAVEAKILHDQKSMVSAGAGGTPAFFVNGKLVSGAKPLSAFQAEVNAAIVEADKMLASGVAKEDLLRAILAKNVNKAFADAVVDGTPVVGGPAPRKPKAPAPPKDTKPVTIDFDESDPVFGPDSAKVTVAIFSDFECPFCSKLVPTMSQIKKEYGEQVRFVFKQHPLSFHKNARLAAKASLAANEQGKFWEYHDVLFANMKALKRADLIRYAGDMGLDIAKFEAAMDAPRMEAAIKEDMAAAQKIGVRGTPHSFVNGKRIKGARPFASFKSFIDEELGVKKKTTEREVIPTMPQVGAVLGASREEVSLAKGFVLKAGTEDGEIVFFGDLQDQFTGKVLRVLSRAMRMTKTSGRLVLRHLPMRFHGNAMQRAKLVQSMQNASPDKLKRLVETLVRDERVLSDGELLALARKIGLDEKRAKAGLESVEVAGEVTRDQELAERLEIVSSPTLFVGGRRFLGTAGYGTSSLVEAIKLAKEGKE